MDKNKQHPQNPQRQNPAQGNPAQKPADPSQRQSQNPFSKDSHQKKQGGNW